MGFVEIQTVQLTFSHLKFKLMLSENEPTCHSSFPKPSVSLGHFCFLIPCIDNHISVYVIQTTYIYIKKTFFTPVFTSQLTVKCKCKSSN